MKTDRHSHTLYIKTFGILVWICDQLLGLSTLGSVTELNPSFWNCAEWGREKWECFKLDKWELGRLCGIEGWPSSRERKLCQILKDYTMTHRSGLRACKQDFSHNLSTESHAALIHAYALLSCYNLHHFDSSNTNLPGSKGEMGRESKIKQGIINQLSVESAEGEYVWTKIGMLRMWLMITVVISHVWW